jgi:hypothetical protein
MASKCHITFFFSPGLMMGDENTGSFVITLKAAANGCLARSGQVRKE